MAKRYLKLLYGHINETTLNDPALIQEKDIKAFQSLLHENEELTLITNGLYYLHLKNWLLHFSLEQMLMVNGEELLIRPWNVIKEIQDFLEIPRLIIESNFTYNHDRGLYCIDTCQLAEKGRTRSLNGKKTVLLPNLNNQSRAMLSILYRRHNEAFYQLTNRTFNW